MGMLRVNVSGTWVDIPSGPPGAGVPPGGATSSVLAKSSAADYATAWTNTLTAPLTIQTDTSGGGFGTSQLVLRPTNLGSIEGGQIGFAGWGASYNTDMYIDRAGNGLRVIHGGTIVGGFNGPGLGYTLGTHPVHGTTYAAMYRPTATGGGDYTILSGGAGDTYINASAGQPINFRINNVQRMTLQDSTYLTLGPGIDGIRLGYGGAWYMADPTWMRSDKAIFCTSEIRASTKFSFDQSGGDPYVLTHSVDTDTGVYYVGDGYMGIVCNGTWALQCKAGYVWASRYRIYGIDDGNHELKYSSAVPPQSGEASNGPILSGYSSVWLYHAVGDKSFFLGSGGNTFINSGNAYQNFSSERLKDDITTLDPHECLAMVRRWRPVRFRWKPDQNAPREIDEGFISEEMYLTTPNLVNVTASDAEVPDWPNAINYPGTAPWLAGAIQALITRIEALEAA